MVWKLEIVEKPFIEQRQTLGYRLGKGDRGAPVLNWNVARPVRMTRS